MEQQKFFDEICGIALVNVYSLTKDTDRIAISPFNPKNKEHLFLMNIAKGASAIIGKSVALDTNRFRLWQLNRGISSECRYEKIKRKERENAINPIVLLDFMRRGIEDDFQVKEFDFGKIYDAFYSKKED